jgi:hypothetical protein
VKIDDRPVKDRRQAPHFPGWPLATACPVLHRDLIESLGTYEDFVTARDAFSAEAFQHCLTKFAIVVAFDGEEEVG